MNMTMKDIKLQEIGRTKWLDPSAPEPSRLCEASSASILESVRFVMEKLSPSLRASAWIETESGQLQINDIQVVFSRTILCRRGTAPVRISIPQDAGVDLSTWDSEGGAQSTS